MMRVRWRTGDVPLALLTGIKAKVFYNGHAESVEGKWEGEDVPTSMLASACPYVSWKCTARCCTGTTALAAHSIARVEPREQPDRERESTDLIKRS